MTGAVRRDCYPATAGLTLVEDALALVAARTAAVADCERVPLHKAAGRVLARDVRATAASPVHDRSAMDGFACRFGDAATSLRCIGRARAGAPFGGAVSMGECVAIATGAVLPKGSDTVVMREQCAVTGDRVVISGPIIQGQNIRRRGEDFDAGDVLLAAGTRLAPQHVGLLAAAGVVETDMRRRVRVAVLSIGDELSPGPAEREGPRIFDANRPMLLAFCERLGANATDLGIVPDRRHAIAAALQDATSTHDVIITSAATSSGDGDHLRAAIRACGGEILAAGVAIKPGKPVAFAKIGGCLHIALPGNPAAALITFLTMGAPLLRQRAGESVQSAPRQMVRATFSCRKKRGLREYLRVTLRQGADGIPEAQRCAKDGSAMLASLAESDGVVVFDEGTTEIAPGQLLAYQSFGMLFW